MKREGGVMVNEETLYMTVEQLGEQIKEKKISPVELTEAYLARLEKYGAKLGAVATITRETALTEARAAEAEISKGKYRGLLHGIPYGAKDLLATKGIKTTWGAPPFAQQMIDADATVIKKLRDAGAILVAKLAMIELAGGGGYNSAKASLQGPSRCPYNLEHWAGGSSSGPGAAVPSALVAFAIGSETLGSIITPSAFSGVSGLRPTYGRVSRAGAMALSWTMDKLGPMCRSAADCGIVLGAIAGPDAADPSCREDGAYGEKGSSVGRVVKSPAKLFSRGKKPPLEGRKIGAIRPDFSRGGDTEVERAYDGALGVLRGMGADVKDTELPDFPYGGVAVTLYQAEMASIFRPFIESEKLQMLVDETQKVGMVASLSLTAADYLDAFRIRAEIQIALGKLFEQFEAIVAPSRLAPANRIDTDFNATSPLARPATDRPTTPPSAALEKFNVIAASNIAGLPALSVPCGFTTKTLPIGIQFVADTLREDVCVEFAAAY
ncbi:MAG: amidase, partial [Acidobacteria bacterium]|nr:amidase [Acidobacteriota bacterium]